MQKKPPPDVASTILGKHHFGQLFRCMISQFIDGLPVTTSEDEQVDKRLPKTQWPEIIGHGCVNRWSEAPAGFSHGGNKLSRIRRYHTSTDNRELFSHAQYRAKAMPFIQRVHFPASLCPSLTSFQLRTDPLRRS